MHIEAFRNTIRQDQLETRSIERVRVSVQCGLVIQKTKQKYQHKTATAKRKKEPCHAN